MSTRVQRTRNALLLAAEDLFSSKGFEKTSIAAICRKAGLSNGVFYRHFKNKDDIFRTITNEMMESFQRSVKIVKSSSKRDELKHLYISAFEALWKSRRRFKAFHEAEYRLKNIEDLVDATYLDAISKILKTNAFEIRPALKWFLIGPIRFSAIYWIIFKNNKVPVEVIDDLLDFTCHGFDIPARMSGEVTRFSINKKASYGNDNRSLIMESAEKLFGKKGYFKTSVYEIMSGAGFGQGTFYLYFKNKQALLEELVMFANRKLRHMMRDASIDLGSRLEKEIRNYRVFLEFMKEHRELYEIVRESEFIVDNLGYRYYEKLLSSYVKALRSSMDSGELRPMNEHSIAIFLMGIGHFMGLDLVFRPRYPVDKWEEYLIDLAKLIARGLEV
ncbi:hypothetical protein AT15_03020 [Kosmotoga arenicorallina S304]|uniref:HTH tetR-type domain-containing protein n=1 Tax=Kosmotoga arenicorallina S304 TaxID=1453497 RepID=A0A182C8H4_9BACT|nr:TetR/AcrR family transcriptional regulator [Kosmotoga arenicorallina]OAA31816.1 hypothetical protein AT15_03020 [Kosmotoga arenicorallina S304]